jgi:hypothetical protein
MTDQTIVNSSFVLGLYLAPSGRITAELEGPDSALPGLVSLLVRTDRQSILGHIFITPVQARQLRLQLSSALEAWYTQHPEELSADAHAELTSSLSSVGVEVQLDEAVQCG